MIKPSPSDAPKTQLRLDPQRQASSGMSRIEALLWEAETMRLHIGQEIAEIPQHESLPK
ncbi:hypothetical protein [Variovorax sp. efr-133-TYG-130]|uniref:hypothetical protein n=1 Tax=Variovorax sp. efr-133-TYG-130 TaxID=3040327 RepID=UPI002556AE28|nr:hypothetical protein [Variovorax sp. efr-133-TYG-130]